MAHCSACLVLVHFSMSRDHVRYAEFDHFIHCAFGSENAVFKTIAAIFAAPAAVSTCSSGFIRLKRHTAALTVPVLQLNGAIDPDSVNEFTVDPESLLYRHRTEAHNNPDPQDRLENVLYTSHARIFPLFPYRQVF